MNLLLKSLKSSSAYPSKEACIKLAKIASQIDGQPMFKILEYAQQLERYGHDVINFELGEPDFETPGANPVIYLALKCMLDYGDVCDSYLSWKGLGDRAPDHIIHAATVSGISHNLNLIDLSRQIVRGTENVLDYSSKNDVRRFLYVSSGAVYGSVPVSDLIP